MNYYKHHIGDYAAATEHLSWDEDMVYTRLLRVYYRDERPIPTDLKRACQLVRATTAGQRRAVETVLREFFNLEDDGWHSKRCDQEIDAAHEKAERNRKVGQKGGRPAKNRNPDGFQTETQTVSRNNPDVTLSNTPLATSHKPVAKEEAAQERALPVDPTPAGALAVALRKAGVTVTSHHPTLLTWVVAGVTPEQALEAVALARQRKGDGTIPPNYLDAIIRGEILHAKGSGRGPIEKLPEPVKLRAGDVC